VPCRGLPLLLLLLPLLLPGKGLWRESLTFEAMRRLVLISGHLPGAGGAYGGGESHVDKGKKEKKVKEKKREEKRKSEGEEEGSKKRKSGDGDKEKKSKKSKTK
jgi:hypothetical protein